MTDPLGDLFTPTTAATLNGNATPRRRRCAHVWRFEDGEDGPVCGRCGIAKDSPLIRRGRTNRARGNRIELEMARALGMRKVGQYGGAEDATSEPFVAQVKSKSGRAFPARWHDEISRLPATAAQTPLLVIAEAGVVGRKRRALVVLRLEDWQSLHGGSGVPREGER